MKVPTELVNLIGSFVYSIDYNSKQTLDVILNNYNFDIDIDILIDKYFDLINSGNNNNMDNLKTEFYQRMMKRINQNT